MHVGEEAKDERVETKAGEVVEEGSEGAVEEAAERRWGEGVEAEEDGKGKGEEVAAGRGGAGSRRSEADRERDIERVGEGRGEEGGEVRERRVEVPVRGGEDGVEVR